MTTVKEGLAQDFLAPALAQAFGQILGEEYAPSNHVAGFYSINESHECNHMAAVSFRVRFVYSNVELIGAGFISGWDGSNWQRANITAHCSVDHANWQIAIGTVGRMTVADTQRV